MDPEAVSRLLSLTSHELRSPLGVIRGYLKWLEQQGPALPDQHRHVVGAMSRASDRLADLLAELSALADLQRRETPVAHEPVALGEFVADVVAAFVAQSRTTTLRAADIVDVTFPGDRALLQAAMISLTTAIGLAQPRESELVITSRLESPGQLRLLVSPPHGMHDGHQVPLNVSRGGLGLRLAMAAEIVSAHGGQISEHHTDGRLYAMVVSLPRSE